MSASLGTVKVGKRVVTASYSCGKAKACAGKASAVLVLGKARFARLQELQRRCRRQGQPSLQDEQEAAQGRQGLQLADAEVTLTGSDGRVLDRGSAWDPVRAPLSKLGWSCSQARARTVAA